MPETRREVLVPLFINLNPPLARAKFEHFYPESKGDRDTVFKRILISVQPAQKRQIDWGEPDDSFLMSQLHIYIIYIIAYN